MNYQRLPSSNNNWPSTRLRLTRRFLVRVIALCFIIFLIVNIICRFNNSAFSGARRTLQSLRYKLTIDHNHVVEYSVPKISNKIITDWVEIEVQNDQQFYMYSAYREENVIRIIAVTPVYSSQVLYCFLQNEGFLISIVEGRVETMKSYIDSPYR